MKSGLERIEATLHDLTRFSTTSSYPKPAATPEVPDPQTRRRTYSFEIAVQKRSPLHQQNEGTLSPQNSERQSSVQKSVYKEPKLPQFNCSSDRNVPICKSDLKINEQGTPCVDVNWQQTAVATYQAQLRKIVCQIQDLYLEGPIVDGWLESYARIPEPKTITLSHESVDQVIDYVEEVYRFGQGITCESPRPGYRLCGLDVSGQKWSRPCPLEQLPSVSIAIGRYQRLKQLLERKQYIELLIGIND